MDLLLPSFVGAGLSLVVLFGSAGDVKRTHRFSWPRLLVVIVGSIVCAELIGVAWMYAMLWVTEGCVRGAVSLPLILQCFVVGTIAPAAYLVCAATTRRQSWISGTLCRFVHLCRLESKRGPGNGHVPPT